jgi:hypothetical protein
MSCNIFKNHRLPKKVKKLLSQHKNDIISKITIGRYKMPDIIMNSINIVSLNKVEREMKKQNLNKLYHVFLIIETISATKFLLEKNERINLVENPPILTNNEYYPILNIPLNLTLEKLLTNTKILLGKFNYYNYDASENDCQDFAIACLLSNKMGSVNHTNFIKQNTEPLFNMPLKLACESIIDLAVIKDKVEEKLQSIEIP